MTPSKTQAWAGKKITWSCVLARASVLKISEEHDVQLHAAKVTIETKMFSRTCSVDRLTLPVACPDFIVDKFGSSFFKDAKTPCSRLLATKCKSWDHHPVTNGCVAYCLRLALDSRALTQISILQAAGKLSMFIGAFCAIKILYAI